LMPNARHLRALSAAPLAAFMAETGELKTAPAFWRDVFFPLIGSLKGS
jgi:hypothetical protein